MHPPTPSLGAPRRAARLQFRRAALVALLVVVGTAASALPAAAVPQPGPSTTYSEFQYSPYQSHEANDVRIVDDKYGNPVIAFGAPGGVHLAQCSNASCTATGPVHVVQGTGSEFDIVMRDGLPVIASYDILGAGTLKLCKNIACTSYSMGTPFNMQTDNYAVSLAVDQNGLVRMAVANEDDGLYTVTCLDHWCDDYDYTLVDPSPATHASIAVDSSGLTRIAYHGLETEDLKHARCLNFGCDLRIVSTLDSYGATGFFPSLAIDPTDGMSVVSYYSTQQKGMKMHRCLVDWCNGAFERTLVTSNLGPSYVPGPWSRLRIPEDGRPALVFNSGASGDIFFVRCGHRTCFNSGAKQYVEVGKPTWFGAGLEISLAGRPIIASNAGNKVSVLSCGSDDCVS